MSIDLWTVGALLPEQSLPENDEFRIKTIIRVISVVWHFRCFPIAAVSPGSQRTIRTIKPAWAYVRAVNQKDRTTVCN